MPETEIWDVVIVGGGPAGLSAATVLARSGRSVLLIDEGKQRNLLSHGLHNFLTRDGIIPPEFLQLSLTELKQYPIRFVKAHVSNAHKSGNLFELQDASGNQYFCKRLLLATGVKDNIPPVPGIKELWGCSVFHCPFCDGFECRDATIGLYAAKKNGFGMALALHHLSKKVILFTDGNFNLKVKQREQLKAQGIAVITKRIQQLQYDKKKLKAVELVTGEAIACSSLFVHHGHHYNDHLVTQLGCRCTAKGAAVTNRYQQTSVNGLYVAGDASIDMHFVVVASAEGVKAGVAIHNDLLAADQKTKGLR